MAKPITFNFYTKTLQKPAKDQKSVENYWRKARKEYASQYAQKLDCKRIITAHHATDLVETMVFRLTKGAGPSGLSPFDISTKPFWEVSKTDLLAYAKDRNLTWIEDTSNQDTDYERNLIRHEVLPHLRTITPNLEKVFTNEAKNFALCADYLNQQIPNDKEPLPLTKFLSLHPVLQRHWLYKMAQGKASSSDIEDTLRWLTHKPQGGSKKILGAKELRLKDQNIFAK